MQIKGLSEMMPKKNGTMHWLDIAHPMGRGTSLVIQDANSRVISWSTRRRANFSFTLSHMDTTSPRTWLTYPTLYITSHSETKTHKTTRMYSASKGCNLDLSNHFIRWTETSMWPKSFIKFTIIIWRLLRRNSVKVKSPGGLETNRSSCIEFFRTVSFQLIESI